MNKATQHIPNFVETDRVTVADFNTVDELLAVDWVKSYEKWDDVCLDCKINND